MVIGLIGYAVIDFAGWERTELSAFLGVRGWSAGFLRQNLEEDFLEKVLGDLNGFDSSVVGHSRI